LKAIKNDFSKSPTEAIGISIAIGRGMRPSEDNQHRSVKEWRQAKNLLLPATFPYVHDRNNEG